MKKLRKTPLPHLKRNCAGGLAPSGLHAGATRSPVTPETLERYLKIINWDTETDGDYCRPNGLTALTLAKLMARRASYGFKSKQRKAVALAIARKLRRHGSMTITQIADMVPWSRWTVARTLKAMLDLGKACRPQRGYRNEPSLFSLTVGYRSELDRKDERSRRKGT